LRLISLDNNENEDGSDIKLLFEISNADNSFNLPIPDGIIAILL